jgi:hypothetical protein
MKNCKRFAINAWKILTIKQQNSTGINPERSREKKTLQNKIASITPK